MKYTLPAILTATVMFALVFAVMPVDNAQAVHTTITGTQLTQAITSVTADIATASNIVCDSDADFTVYVSTGGPAADNTNITITDGTNTVTIVGDLFGGGDGAGGFGSDGFSGAISADAAVTITVAGSGADDVFVTMITTSGATAACVV
ncbi:MAG: hypothetical protein IIA83_00220 [Thaumarchaeota archaeon]|nr:hypothetical protein [Nitrososphaerota archaeon]